MAGVQIEKFNLNQFYEKTPTVLKYILVISLIVVGSYFLIGRKVTKGQDVQLDKIEQSIETAYTLIDQFDKFEAAQYRWNEDIMDYLRNIYTLVEELNENTNRKFDILLAQGGQNTESILNQIALLNETYAKVQEAYTPNELKESNIPDPREKWRYQSDPSFMPVEEIDGEQYLIDGIIAIRLDKNGNPIDTLTLNELENKNDKKYE